MGKWSPKRILLLAAVVCFALETIGLVVQVDLLALGLALGFGSFLVE
jgi:hypothetical protein